MLTALPLETTAPGTAQMEGWGGCPGETRGKSANQPISGETHSQGLQSNSHNNWNQQNAPQTSPQALVGTIPQLKFLLPEDSSLCPLKEN